MDAATAFHPLCQPDRGAAALYLPGWAVEDLRALFAHGEAVTLRPGDALMRLGQHERAVYFVVSGALEVASGSQANQTMGSLVRESPGAVIGEVALFDGQPRTASVWATELTELVKVPLAGLQAFTDKDPKRGSELYFALGRILAFRYRRGEERSRRGAAAAG